MNAPLHDTLAAARHVIDAARHRVLRLGEPGLASRKPENLVLHRDAICESAELNGKVIQGGE